ncbi:MAG: beta-galactosidase [Anaerolineae bacterium]|nr:beta-galactosidase [Anaerolineae bacterium]
MRTLTVKDGQFWLDNRPQFIHAGEFHYYRAPAEQWRHRLGLLRDAGFNTVASYIPWLWHQPQPGMTDFDGHTHPLRNLAGFLDLATEMGFYIIARPGPYIMAETINEGIPPWLFEQHPQLAFIGQDAKPQNVVSYLHPDFLNAVQAWYAAVFNVLTPRQVTQGGNILMIQLDNEMGMIQWVRNLVDMNPDTLTRFAAYLRQHYGEDLNQQYPAANLIDYLHEEITQPKQPHAQQVIEDYRRFYRSYLREYMTFLWQTARGFGMEVPPIVNIHGFGNGGKTFPIGLSQLVEVMAMEGMVSATDVYPIFIGEGNFHQLILVNEMTRALHHPQQPLFSVEFQAGGNQDFGGAQSSLYDLHSRLCISCGMRAINHYLFFDGENDPILSPARRHDWGHPVRKDGTLRRHYARYPRLSKTLSAYGEALIQSRTRRVTTIGFTIDSYMTEVNNTYTRPQTDIVTHQRDVILFDFLARGMALTHRPFNALELTRARLDPAETPTVWVMMEKQCEAAVQQKLADYIQQGGQLILVGRLCEETFDHTPCSILRDAVGIHSVQTAPTFKPALIQVFSYTDVPVSFVETYTGDFDQIFAVDSSGQTVGFLKQIGKGTVMMLGAALAANTLDDLDIVHQMANRIGCPSLFTMTDWTDVRLCEGPNGSFLFINNYQDDPVETVISMDGAPLLGGNPVHLPARRGVILPLDWQPHPGIHLHYSTAEITDVIATTEQITILTEPADFVMEVSLTGYRCDEMYVEQQSDDNHFVLSGTNGEIKFKTFC